MHADSWKTGISNSTRHGMLTPWNKEKKLERSKLRKVYWIRVKVRIVSIPRKLSTIRERRQTENYLFRRGDYRNKSQNPEYVVNLSSAKAGFCSLETRRYWQTAPRPKHREKVLRSSPGKDDYFFSSVLGTTEKKWRQDQNSLFRHEGCRNKGHNPENPRSFRVAMKTFCEPWKLMTAWHK
jgi:hypothetical protein